MPARKRLFCVDALRGIGLLLMVQDHAYDWWMNAAAQATFWSRFTEFLGPLAAPIFLMMVGTSTTARSTVGWTVPSPICYFPLVRL
jgi:uncharacterized membrane protein